MRRVVVTGLGCVTPVGNDVPTFWESLKAGKCGIGPITQYDPTGLKVQLAAEVKDFQPETVLDRQAAKRMGRFTQFAMVASRQAMESSGLDRAQVDLDRCGVIISSGIGGIAITEAEHERGKEKGWDRISPFYIPTTIANMAAGQVAIDTGFRGMCTCPVTACAGGTNAVGDAFRYIRDGYGEVMLCGGAESCVTPLAIGGFTSMKALSQSTDPKRASIPFDLERNGFVLGEGAGVLLLEELDHARKRGQTVYVETCPQYLLLDESVYFNEDYSAAARYVCAPPLRDKAEQEYLWKGMRRGAIQTVSTDHCSFTLAQKDMGREDFTKIPGGLPGVETRGELIYSYGVAKRKISAAQMCRLLSENPARLYGLYPRKGVLRPGSDADIVVYDPGASHVIRAEDCVANVDYNPYEGFVTAGGIRQVWLRGRLSVEDGRVLAEAPAGKYMVRGKNSL